jgi:hypothetical protein
LLWVSWIQVVQPHCAEALHGGGEDAAAGAETPVAAAAPGVVQEVRRRRDGGCRHHRRAHPVGVRRGDARRHVRRRRRCSGSGSGGSGGGSGGSGSGIIVGGSATRAVTIGREKLRDVQLGVRRFVLRSLPRVLCPVLRPGARHAVAVQVAFESKGLKPVFHLSASRVETRRFQATSICHQLGSTCTAPPRACPSSPAWPPCPPWRAARRAWPPASRRSPRAPPPSAPCSAGSSAGCAWQPRRSGTRVENLKKQRLETSFSLRRLKG